MWIAGEFAASPRGMAELPDMVATRFFRAPMLST